MPQSVTVVADSAEPNIFYPGSDFIRDMKAIILSARTGAEQGQAANFEDALFDIFETLDRRRTEPGYSGRVTILDWNWRRLEGRRRRKTQIKAMLSNPHRIS